MAFRPIPGAGRGPGLRRQLALLLALAVAPALLLAVAFGARSYALATDRADRQFLRAAAGEAREIREILVGARAALQVVAGALEGGGPGAEGCAAALSAAAAQDEVFALAFAADARGRLLCASDRTAASLGFRLEGELSALAESGGPRLDFVTLGDSETGARAAAALASLPLPAGGDGAPTGFLGLVAPLERLRGDGGEGPPVARDLPPLRHAVVDSAGMVMLEGASGGWGWLPAAEALRPALSEAARLVRATSTGGEDWVYAATPLWEGRAWRLSGAPRDALHAPALSRAAAPIAAPVLMLLLAVAMAYFGIDRLVVRHVVHLARLTRAYGRGRLSLRPSGLERAPAELAELGAEMGRMAGGLQQREEQLREAAETNRVLLREVHHRVKNNLQMIVSLLNLQARRAQRPEERGALDALRARVMAVAAVHGAIYAAERLDRAPLAALTRRVAEPPADLGGREGPELTLELEEIEETPERATPFALLVNEAVTNAVKYAATADGGRAQARVELAPRAEGGWRLRVENDVAGPVPEAAPDSVGARLMEGFARQIGGRLTRDTSGGRFRVTLEADAAGPGG